MEDGRLFIEQPYELYSPENHEAWRRLFARMRPRWERYANPRFREGIARLALDPERIPRLEDVNRFLNPLTGFRARPVSGYVPAYMFFDRLRRREFPTTITIRRSDALDYLPEPDVFHDIAGHVPMHTDRAFADALVRFGEVARAAAEGAGGDVHVLASRIRALARFFWFTIEFGLMETPDGVRVYGSGLLSSYGEIAHAIDAPEVERRPADLFEMVNRTFEIDAYQPLLYVVPSFEALFGMVGDLEAAMRAGGLDDVAGGEPEVNERDLASFLQGPPVD